MDFLNVEWLSKPAWMWLGFFAIVGVLLAFDLGVLHRRQREIGVRESLLLSSVYLSLGVAFGGLVWWLLLFRISACPARSQAGSSRRVSIPSRRLSSIILFFCSVFFSSVVWY